MEALKTKHAHMLTMSLIFLVSLVQLYIVHGSAEYGPQASKSISSYGVVQSSGVHILYENHVNSKNDLVEGDKYKTGKLSYSPETNTRPEITVDLVDNPVHSSPLSGRCQVLTPWKGENYYRISVRITVNEPDEFYASCWHYFPSSFKQENSYPQIMAYKEWHPYKECWRLTATKYPDYRLRVVRQLFAGDGEAYGTWGEYTLDEKLPLDKWFRTTVYVKKHSTDGIIKFWLNDKLIFERYNVQTLVHPAGTIYEGKTVYHAVTVHFCYVKPNETHSFTNYFDDIIISDRFITIEEEKNL